LKQAKPSSPHATNVLQPICLCCFIDFYITFLLCTRGQDTQFHYFNKAARHQRTMNPREYGPRTVVGKHSVWTATHNDSRCFEDQISNLHDIQPQFHPAIKWQCVNYIKLSYNRINRFLKLSLWETFLDNIICHSWTVSCTSSRGRHWLVKMHAADQMQLTGHKLPTHLASQKESKSVLPSKSTLL